MEGIHRTRLPAPVAAQDAPAELAALLTVVLVTSPTPSNPSTALLELVLGSLALVPGLCACRKIIVCDGYRELAARSAAPEAAPKPGTWQHRRVAAAAAGRTSTVPKPPLTAKWKSGRIDSAAAARYAEYIAAARRFCELASERRPAAPATATGFSNCSVDAAGAHLGFAFAVERGLRQVRTPWVLVMQHDRKFNRGFDLGTLLTMLDVNVHPEMRQVKHTCIRIPAAAASEFLK